LLGQRRDDARLVCMVDQELVRAVNGSDEGCDFGAGGGASRDAASCRNDGARCESGAVVRNTDKELEGGAFGKSDALRDE
jgi:hypothetical protein